MDKILFQEVQKENDILYLEGGRLDLIDDSLVFNKIIFNDYFIVKNDGILSASHDGFLKKVSDSSDDTYSWDLYRNDIEDSLSEIKFIYCEFTKEPIFSSSQFTHISFHNCIFKDRIEKIFEEYPDTEIIFDNCKFDNISFNQWNEEDKIKKFKLYGGNINKLRIINNTLSEKFYINKQYDGNNQATVINELIIQNTIFLKNFKLHNCHVNQVLIKDTDFEKNADFYKSEFKKRLFDSDDTTDKTIYFSSLNFRLLALFGECVFEEKCSFKYVTFEGYSHFRGAEFKKGLDLDYTNIQKEMNFFGVKKLDTMESKENTSQETYRILKHNFQKIGNQIEANKYHSLELDIHRQRTWDKILKRDFINRFPTETSRALELLSDGFVSLFHYISSNHSRTWIVPIFWILVVGFFTNICMDCPEIKFSFMDMFKYVSIANFDKCLKEHYVIFFLNKISLGYLYYQFIIATRKNTKK